MHLQDNKHVGEFHNLQHLESTQHKMTRRHNRTKTEADIKSCLPSEFRKIFVISLTRSRFNEILKLRIRINGLGNHSFDKPGSNDK